MLGSGLLRSGLLDVLLLQRIRRVAMVAGVVHGWELSIAMVFGVATWISAVIRWVSVRRVTLLAERVGRKRGISLVLRLKFLGECLLARDVSWLNIDQAHEEEITYSRRIIPHIPQAAIRVVHGVIATVLVGMIAGARVRIVSLLRVAVLVDVCVRVVHDAVAVMVDKSQSKKETKSIAACWWRRVQLRWQRQDGSKQRRQGKSSAAGTCPIGLIWRAPAITECRLTLA